MQNKYTAFTLLEMLVVMGIMMILMGMTFTSFSGLQDTVKMNEYMLNMEQDIRSVQRASMLLERNTEENWLYGLGIDFSKLKEEDGGIYTTFKWCSHYGDYGDPSTRGKVPGYSEGDRTLDGAKLPIGNIEMGLCIDSNDTLKILPGYTSDLTPPKSVVEFNSAVRYVVFESVTGRAFFYDTGGNLLNYFFDEDGQLVIKDPDEVEELDFTITSLGAAAPRRLVIHHLSGRIEAIIVDSETQEVERVPVDGELVIPPEETITPVEPTE